ncbi:hypothetical protein BDK92_7191 [Micromonospora pisi]|uniref:Uncharacterized protein n=1 Tax=Micromonospora pisi TaxID=589240 RepID=A0A495JUP1_9ACTN|nr:hypothetical protein [Micromonospora pisi]RKR92713.1 hypothetical protein BDK92_7191 [Micromonospora pisi]
MPTRLDAAREAATTAATNALAGRGVEAVLCDQLAAEIVAVLLIARSERGLTWLRGMRATARQNELINRHHTISALTLFATRTALQDAMVAAADALVAALGRRTN